MSDREPLALPKDAPWVGMRESASVNNANYYLHDIAESLRTISDKFEALGNLDEFTEATKKWMDWFEQNTDLNN
jgi:hypothetical protein